MPFRRGGRRRSSIQGAPAPPRDTCSMKSDTICRQLMLLTSWRCDVDDRSTWCVVDTASLMLLTPMIRCCWLRRPAAVTDEISDTSVRASSNPSHLMFRARLTVAKKDIYTAQREMTFCTQLSQELTIHDGDMTATSAWRRDRSRRLGEELVTGSGDRRS